MDAEFCSLDKSAGSVEATLPSVQTRGSSFTDRRACGDAQLAQREENTGSPSRQNSILDTVGNKVCLAL